MEKGDFGNETEIEEEDSERSAFVVPRTPVPHVPLEYDELLKVVAQAKMGDEAAFERVLSHMCKALTDMMDSGLYIMGSEDQDIWQEGAVKLMNVIAKFDSNKGNFNSFAQSSIKKHILTQINKEQAKKRSPLNKSQSLNTQISSENGSTTSFLDELQDISDPVEGFHISLIESDFEEFIITEISKSLSQMEKLVFYRRIIEEMTYKEIAMDLGLTRRDVSGQIVPDQKSVDNAIWRSRPKIKKVMERLGITPSEAKSLVERKFRGKSAKKITIKNMDDFLDLPKKRTRISKRGCKKKGRM